MTEERRMYDKIFDEKLDRIAADLKKLNDNCVIIHRVMYGNGTPKGSIIDRLARFETKLSVIWSVLLIVIGTLVKVTFF